MTPVQSTVSVARNPLIRCTLAKLFRHNQATPTATATLTEATVPMDTASTTALLTVMLPIAMGLMVNRPEDQVLVSKVESKNRRKGEGSDSRSVWVRLSWDGDSGKDQVSGSETRERILLTS